MPMLVSMSLLGLHTALSVGARLMLDLAAVAVVVCCLHIRRLRPSRPRRTEVVLLATAVPLAAGAAAVIDDLALATLAVLAALAAAVWPTVVRVD